ncbi:MAG: hypothetical protein R3F48_07850 [Candidatus Zixiibacteriota bacterium]
MIDNLKIISRDLLVTFEAFSDEHAFKLAHEMETNGKLRNPLLVYPLYDKYLLLDDACILKALESLDIRHIPVQIADEDTLSVHPWQRVVEDWRLADLKAFCDKFPRQVSIVAAKDEPLEAHQVEIRFRDSETVRLNFNSGALLVRVDMYNKLSAEVTRGNQSFRAKLDLFDVNPFQLFERATAVIFPPMFTIDELAQVALSGLPLAQGIIRIDQPGRILGVDYALSILQESAAPAEKESFFRQLIQMRISSDRTSFYYGSIFMFNN